MNDLYTTLSILNPLFFYQSLTFYFFQKFYFETMSNNFGPSLSYKIHRLNLLISYFTHHLSMPFKVYLIKLACLCQLHHIIQVVIHFKFYHLTIALLRF